MTDYRIELQAFVDAAASFTEPALGHHKAWAEAVARARVALSMPESSASTVCPITPPPELVDKIFMLDTSEEGRIIAAYRAGADAELEASCEWLRNDGLFETRIGHLRTARRPKPPSLKEQALEAMSRCDSEMWCEEMEFDLAIIRTALESLPS